MATKPKCMIAKILIKTFFLKKNYFFLSYNFIEKIQKNDYLESKYFKFYGDSVAF